MTIKPNKIARRLFGMGLNVAPAVLHVMKTPYWVIVKAIINYWGKQGLHPITVGQFRGGANKKRSIYREEMLLKTIYMFLNVRDKSCLDLACNDGFWSFRLARLGLKSVMGVDASKKYIAKANFLKHVYDFPSFKFKQQDVFKFVFDNQQQSFDIVLLLSIIYHLPNETNWNTFFGLLSQMNRECLIIDSRWFEDDEYWYDKSSGQALLKTKKTHIMKWRPTRKEVFEYLYASGYIQLIEINPSDFLVNQNEAYGNGNPYTFENVADYITGHRSLVIAYKKETELPEILKMIGDKHTRGQK